MLEPPQIRNCVSRRSLLRWGLGLCLAPAITTSSSAGDGYDILRVAGDVASAPVVFSDADLMLLPQIAWKTSTIWTKQVNEFSGPSLDAVLRNVRAGGGDLELRALNDYSVKMPRELVERGAPIIANRINGAPFPVRRRGPLWVVFPYDSDVRFQSELFYSLSIWQLSEISVL